MIAVYIIIGLLLIIAIWYISTSNRINRCLVKIDEASSGIDVSLTKRYDVLTKMIETVKGYAKHEKETLFEVVNLRKDMTFVEKQKASTAMDKNLHQIHVLAEQYPELKASENFNTLQKAIVEVEEHLQAARRMYNSNVSILNQMLVTFPDKIVANMKHIEKKQFFEADEVKKEDVKIEF